ncbi:hypothetical protein ANN_03600 [Periplaneta americana]|uniref:Uncharacterized protein n=1 Tax=Periplaneta americana TaxID=6978 RepID=A0ABQ8TZA6_PERAM|nr:hypothetical protein ANN_03600 [Periplaneta americana]
MMFCIDDDDDDDDFDDDDDDDDILYVPYVCYLASELDEGDNAGEMSPGSNTESYPAFPHIGLRETPGKNVNQVTYPNRESNPGHLVLRPDALTVTPQVWTTLQWVTVKTGELLRIDRRNTVRSIIANRFREHGEYEVYYEEVQCLSTEGSTRRANIIIIDRDKKTGLILDPTVSFEVNEDQPKQKMEGWLHHFGPETETDNGVASCKFTKGIEIQKYPFGRKRYGYCVLRLEGLLRVDIMPHGTTINSDGYVATLKELQVRLSRVRRHREKQDVLLLHNEHPYVSHKTTDQIRKFG